MGFRRDRDVARRLAAIESKLDSLAESAQHREHDKPADTDLPAQLARIQDILQIVYDREPEMRERLHRLREEPGYERTFTEREPLVSVVIPTYDRGELLLSRAIPSVLGQSYENFEIVVVGDAAPDDTGRWISDLNDPRVSYTNLRYRGPYPKDARDLWHVAGVPPRNAAVRLAKGSWIAPLDDDDAFASDHIERLIELAKRERCEVAYGGLRCLMNDGSQFTLGVYPPEFGHFGWQGAIFHGGLSIFETELADALFFSPADWSLCRRMLRAGVRFAMLDAVVTDHYESRFAPASDSE
jgi:Glycosyl transferase family 2